MRLQGTAGHGHKFTSCPVAAAHEARRYEALNMEVTRKEQVYIYLFQKFNELKEKGLLVGGNWQVNPDKLYLIEGFEPTEQEIHEAMNVLDAQGYVKREILPFPGYCCQKCGEQIGYVGRFLQIFGLFHKCKSPHNNALAGDAAEPSSNLY